MAGVPHSGAGERKKGGLRLDRSELSIRAERLALGDLDAHPRGPAARREPKASALELTLGKNGDPASASR